MEERKKGKLCRTAKAQCRVEVYNNNKWQIDPVNIGNQKSYLPEQN